MSAPTSSAGRLLWQVLLLGLAGDFLFRVDHLGLNVLLWVGGVAWFFHAAARREREALPEEFPGHAQYERNLLLVALALAAAWVWRDNPMLRFLDAVGLIVVFALLPLGGLARLPVGSVIRASLGLAGRGATGLLPTLLEAERVSRGTSARRALPLRALLRGLVIAVPTGMVFGSLLGSADPVFGNLLNSLLLVDPELLASHALGITAGAWIGAALLRGALVAPRRATATALPHHHAAAIQPKRGLGPIEVAMTLGTVDLLFAGFIAVQLPYFFGGSDWVQRTAGITLAEYARRGFFELVVVTALVLPLLLVLHVRLTEDDPRANRIYRSLAGIQVALLFAIIGSGMHRMALYQAEFGLTEDRFFASAFMLGAAVTCGWFMATVLRGRPLVFVRGAVLAWGVWLGLLNVVNPEQIIVDTNLRRFREGKPLDATYLTQLSTDAVPALVAALPTLPEAERNILRDGLTKRSDIHDSDLRDWHVGRNRARRAILTLNEAPSP